MPSLMLERYSRLQAFTVHLAISLAVFVVLAAAMVLYWFPGPYFAADGGWQGIRIIAAVDLVLGPTLTLIFFDSKKKKHRALLFDLSAIATVQVIALAWGTWTVYNERTVAIVFSKTQFFSVSHGALKEANAALREADREPADINALSTTHPRQIYVSPIARQDFGKYMADILNGLPEIQLRTDRYDELAKHWPEVDEAAVDLAQLAQQHPALAAALEDVRDELDTLRFYRLQLRFGSALAGFDRETRKLKYIFTYTSPPPKQAAGTAGAPVQETQ